MPLAAYHRKREFSRTPEPAGSSRRPSGSRRKFVVQKHQATHLHYDFRLEYGGVLKSWAVPKGPSLDPAQKRLAVEVEDHPLEYGKFEGIIPAGEYGAGTVLIWDRGTWRPEGSPQEGFRAGKLTFTLSGKKLKGSWTLVRLHSPGSSERNWLLIKARDEFARPKTRYDVLRAEPDSVASGRSLAQIAAAASRAANQSQRKARSNNRSGERQRVRSASAGAGARARPNHPDPVAGVRLTHPERIMYPQAGITKRQLAEFYVAIADWILPHLKHRPLALVRCPDGVGEHCFYQKHPGKGAPVTLERVGVREEHKLAQYAIVNDVAGLVSLVQMGVLEIHPWGSRVDEIERPDRLIFDLDPAPDVPWPHVIEGARRIRGLLEELELTSFLKTTGGKGLHVVVPIDRRQGWEEAKAFAKGVATELARRWPENYTTNLSKSKRRGKVFLDYLRNQRGATAIAPYSTRARPGAPVATPIAWDELSPRLRSDHFRVANLRKRLAQLATDPWRDLATTRQTLKVAAIEYLARAGH